MNLELPDLDLRYEGSRLRAPRREAALLAAITREGIREPLLGSSAKRPRSCWTREGQPAVPQLAPSAGVRLWTPQAFTAFALGSPGGGGIASPPLSPVSISAAPPRETNVTFQFTAATAGYYRLQW